MDKLPQVLECHHVTGDSDFMLKVVVKDVAAYQRFLENTLLENVPMANIKSAIVFKQTKTGTALLIGEHLPKKQHP